MMVVLAGYGARLQPAIVTIALRVNVYDYVWHCVAMQPLESCHHLWMRVAVECTYRLCQSLVLPWNMNLRELHTQPSLNGFVRSGSSFR